MRLTILGCNGAIPAYERFPTSQILEVNQQYMLVDCGEGTQILLQKYGISILKIHHIFISHMHGDHFFGLIGLLNTMALLGKTNTVNIYCPEKLKLILETQIEYKFPFEINYFFLIQEEKTCLLNTPTTEVYSFQVFHSVPTWGFLFIQKKRKRKLLKDKLTKFEIPIYFYNKLTEGEDYETKTGEIIKNEWLTADGEPWIKYAYCADTRYAEEILTTISSVNCIYHEATYLDEEMLKAEQRLHTTAKQAATIAKKANVGNLIIGHFSSKYKNPELLLAEAKQIFENTILAEEGLSIEIQ